MSCILLGFGCAESIVKMDGTVLVRDGHIVEGWTWFRQCHVAALLHSPVTEFSKLILCRPSFDVHSMCCGLCNSVPMSRHSTHITLHTLLDSFFVLRHSVGHFESLK